MRRRPPLPGMTVILLSGGADSRHILLEHLHQGRSFDFAATTVRWRFEDDDDLEIASALCRQLSVNHRPIEQKAFQVDAETRKNFLTNMMTDESTFLMSILDSLKGNRPTVYDGIGGDILSAGLYLTEKDHRLIEKQEFTTLSRNLLRYDTLAADIADDLFNMRRQSEDLVVDQISEALKARTGEASPISMFYFWNRTRREISTSPYGIYSNMGLVYCPYLDFELFDFLTSLPAHFLWNHSLHRKAIAKAYPELVDVPYAKRIGMPNRLDMLRTALGLFRTCINYTPTATIRVMSSLANAGARARDGKFDFNWRLVHYLIQLRSLAASGRALDQFSRFEKSTPVFSNGVVEIEGDQD